MVRVSFLTLKINIDDDIYVHKFDTYILFGGFRSLLRWLEVMIFLVDIADDVVIDDSILASPIKPRFFFRVVRPVLQPLQLIAKVQNVVGLLVSKCAILILSEHFDHVLLLSLLDLLLSLWVGKSLSNGIVLDFNALDVFTCDFFVGLCLSLEIFLALVVCNNISLPIVIAVFETHGLVCFCQSVTSSHF